MTSLPITRMTLDQHGVGFFERRAQMNGKEVELSFPVEAMNDVLKSNVWTSATTNDTEDHPQPPSARRGRDGADFFVASPP